MTDPTQLTDFELLWLGSLVLLMLGCVVWAARSRDPRAWMQPPMVVGLIFFYYTVAGPLNALNQQKWMDRGANLRSGMGLSWAGACISFLAFLVGYALIHQRLRPPRLTIPFQASRVHKLGQSLNLFGIGLFGLASGARLITYLNPTGVAGATIAFEGINLGAFTNYFLYALNLMVPGCLLMAAAWIQRRDTPVPLLLWLMAALLIFTSLGFRWRIAVLAGSLLMLWCIARRIRPNLMMLIPSIFGLLLMAGTMELSRNYAQGLDLTQLEGRSLTDILLAAFNESHVFLTSGALIQLTPTYIPYAGATPIINTILFPLPSALFPAKDSARYILNATATIYGGELQSAGAVLLNYAEYFLIAGWPSLIICSMLLGWLCRRLWLWYNLRNQEPLAQVIYVCNAGFLYVVISRGYMPQVAMLWCFTVAPLFILYYFNKRAELREHRARMPRSTRKLLPPHLLNQRTAPLR